MGQPAIADDPRYAVISERLKRRADVEGAVTAWTSARTKAEISTVLGGKVPFGPVQQVDEIFADPHTAARGMLATVELPGCPDHPLVIAGTAVKMTATPGGVRTRAPLTGEHTARVLGDFGFTEGEIAQLRAAKAVG